MRREINSRSDHVAFVERLSQRPYTTPYVVIIELEDGRTTDQNALMWASLREVSKQVQWDGQYLSPEDWKDLFSATLRKQRPVHGIEGGLVFLGLHTSKMSKQEMSDLMELIFSFGVDHGVQVPEHGENNATV